MEPFNIEPATIPTPAPWSLGRLTGLVLPGYEGLDPESLPWSAVRSREPLPSGVRLAKRSRSRLVLRVATECGHLYVKQATAHGIRRIVSARLQGPKTWREWNIGFEFLRAGIRVPLPVLYAADGAKVSYLATCGFPRSWTSLRRWFKRNGLNERVFGDLARAAAWLHALPAYHGDFRADHIYLTDAPEGAPPGRRFAFLDLDGAHIGRPVRRAERLEALYELFLSLVGCGLDERAARAFLAAYDPGGAQKIDAVGLCQRAAQDYRGDDDEE